MVGAMSELDFASSTAQVEDFGLLMLYSDGVFEIERADGTTWPFGDFVDFMASGPRSPDPSSMDRLIASTRAMMGSDEYVDDFSIVELLFPPPND